MQGQCIRRKFAARLRKGLLQVIGAIVSACILLVILAMVSRWLDSWKYANPAAAISGGVIALVILVGGIAAARDWCKDTWQRCQWECEDESKQH